MQRENRETIFQLLSISLLIIGGVFGNQIVLILSVIPITFSIWFWYQDNIRAPIIILQKEIRNIRKDLNTRKELEEIKLRLYKLEDDKK